MRFLFVRPALCLRLPSDSALRRTPLPSGYQFPLPGLEGISTPKFVRPAGRTKIKKPFCQTYTNLLKTE
jgi:hypothetical protein